MKDKSIIDIDDIKFVFDKSNTNYKTKLYLVELLLVQKQTQKNKLLLDIIINLEKEYLLKIFNNDDSSKFDIGYYSSFKNLMIKFSEILFKANKNIVNELINIIPCLSENIKTICEVYKKSLDNNNNPINLESIYIIYNSFIFRCFYLIIQKLLANKILLKESNSILSLYKIIIFLDNFSQNIKNNCLDMNNIIEIKNYLI